MATLGFKALSVVGSVLGGAIDAVRSITGHGKKADQHAWQAPTPTDGAFLQAPQSSPQPPNGSISTNTRLQVGVLVR